RLLSGALFAWSVRTRFRRGTSDGGAITSLPAGSRRQGALVLSAPVADAGFLAVPDSFHGPRADDGHLPGSLHPLPRASWAGEALGPQGLGLPRRWRDGRAGVHGRAHHAGAREARQPHFRRELQPAAARR